MAEESDRKDFYSLEDWDEFEEPDASSQCPGICCPYACMFKYIGAPNPNPGKFGVRRGPLRRNSRLMDVPELGEIMEGMSREPPEEDFLEEGSEKIDEY